MLATTAAFPDAGSTALIIDRGLPESRQRPELVRIVRWVETRWARKGEDCCQVAFIARGEFKIVQRRELIDGTPLTRDEARELADLQRHLHGRQRSARLAYDFDRLAELKGRATWSTIYQRLAREAADQLQVAA